MSEPTRPGEIPHSAPLVELADNAVRHTGALFDHQCGIAALTDAGRVGHALAGLAYQHALAERALHGRWVMACEALDAGSTHGQVADAMGLDVEELCAGLRSWARTQLREGLIDDARHARVLALLGEPVAADPADHLPTWQLRRLVQLLDALGDPATSLQERASLIVLAGQDQATVDNLAGLLRRARGAES